jgi:predicted RNA-binding protein
VLEIYKTQVEVEKMCEANAYMLKNGVEELYLEGVDRIIPQEDGILMENIFGQKKLVKAKIKEMALVDHKIILEKID